MLKLKPNCECCDKDLPANSEEAMMCSYECTFCKDCVDNILSNVCPNCGGGFAARPIRPSVERLPNAHLGSNPASTVRVNTKLSRQEIANIVNPIKDIPPAKR